jgi:hypothetical protein
MTLPNSIWNEKYNEKWALIPSDPGTWFCIAWKKKYNRQLVNYLAVFDDMIKEYNVKDTKVQEVLTLDFEDLTKDG